jgi:hypothetical protein
MRYKNSRTAIYKQLGQVSQERIMALITASVGKAGRNIRQDVTMAQQLLKKVGFDPGPVDGICGPKTIAAIGKFQSSFLSRPDGLIEPNKTTWRKLAAGQYAVSKQWEGDSAKWTQEKKLASLNPAFRQKVEVLLRKLEARGFRPKIFYGWRSVAVQQELVKKGRSRVRFSFHNAKKPDGTPDAYASDIIDSRYGWLNRQETRDYWKAQGEEAKELKLIWGGDWKNPWDPAHVQFFPSSQLSAIKKKSGL